MDYIETFIGKTVSRHPIERLLTESLAEGDPYCRRTREALLRAGLGEDSALMLLAQHRSKVKYGYEISPKTLAGLTSLSKTTEGRKNLAGLIKAPFFLVKACWLYEHAPYFFFYGDRRAEDLDALIIDFADRYQNDYLGRPPDLDFRERLSHPKRVRRTTFWENKTIDPTVLIRQAVTENLEGLEYGVDFHPFNDTTLLPEEIGPEKREQIRDVCKRSGVAIDIHSPIVGPYVPSPNPAEGKQRFFDPLDALEIQYDTIDLAKDVGAGSVVFHLIDYDNLNRYSALVERAGGSSVRVTIENYCQTCERQTSDKFLEGINELYGIIPKELRKKNFGITLDVGHLNIEGEDPLVAAERIGSWCKAHNVDLRVHATDNYGNLLFSPPDYSADVHSNVSGRGINNTSIIVLLRSLGLQFDVVAEQIQPLTEDDILIIQHAQTCPLDGSLEHYARKGKEGISASETGALIHPEVMREKAYQFLAGSQGVSSLKEHLVYRKIQDQEHLSVEEAKKISRDFMRMPEKLKSDLTSYMDDLLLPIQSETGALSKNTLDLICQNISGALFATISNEHLNQLFSEDKVFQDGELICEQGKAGTEMYFIKQGKVAVFLDGSHIDELGPGEIFGEMSLFYNINRSATIRAAENGTRVGAMSRKDLEALLTHAQPYSRDLIFRLYNILPERLRNLSEKYKAAIQNLSMLFRHDEKGQAFFEDLRKEMLRENAGFFPKLSEKEAKDIFEEERHFKPGTHVFHEGDPGDGAYLVLEGRLKVTSTIGKSEEVHLGELQAGEVFGEMALIDDKPRSADVITISPCKTVFMGKNKFNGFIHDRSEMALRWMGFICLSLFSRILRLDRVYTDMKRRLGEAFDF